MIPDKVCQTCGRAIEWRNKWEKNWEEVRYCSTRCRKSKPKTLDRKLEKTILRLLDQRANQATICPGEAARAIFPEDQWRDHMEQTRQAARRLVASGQIEILQKGMVVDPSTAKGPIRLRKK
ncbi:DUF2256 and DUF3253 domain-containing protein [Akkermansiaceae bacterium]|jgi:hypothetical protein|nr:DUF2256 and DUF3253 domain-containing protein [Akkermansiaceae bacterium]